MKYLYASFMLMLLTTCAVVVEEQTAVPPGQYRSYYKEVSTSYVLQMEELEEITSRGMYTLLEGLDVPTNRGNRYQRLLLQKQDADSLRSFLFNEFTRYEGGEIGCYGAPFSSHQDTSMGFWFHAEFYTQFGRKGVKYDFSGLPPNRATLEKETVSEGVYLLKKDRLLKICPKQTEDCFHSKRLTGTYYLPKPGLFFRRFRFEEIE